MSSSGPCHTKSSPLGFLNANLYIDGVDLERWEIRTVWSGLRGGFGLEAFFSFSMLLDEWLRCRDFGFGVWIWIALVRFARDVFMFRHLQRGDSDRVLY